MLTQKQKQQIGLEVRRMERESRKPFYMAPKGTKLAPDSSNINTLVGFAVSKSNVDYQKRKKRCN